MVAASKGAFLEEMLQLGYGAYNMSGNNKFKMALTIFAVAGTCAGNPSEGIRFYEKVRDGEDKLSQLCIDLGKQYMHNR